MTGEGEAEIDVIDLGAPRRRRPARPRLPHLYTPNTRLYPGRKEERYKKKRTTKTRRRHKFTRTAPNPRLYKRAPPPPPPPPARPRASWPAPPRGALDTASRAALRLREQRARPATSFAAPPAPAPAPVRATVMATGKYSTSPDCSDGNDASSAPSEFLAEFLSAIMRRQYAEALKYCQLILQYEPHNATAQGFYPLLRHKLHARGHDETSSSDDTSSKRGGLFHAHFRKESESKDRTEEVEEADEAEGGVGGRVDMEQGSSRSGSVCSSLELDSSTSPPPSPPDRTDHSDSSSWRWESGGERSERDDNGNLARGDEAEAVGDTADADADEENNTASALHNMCTKGEAEASPLQRLRARFACSIK